ncbi:MAG: nucleotidyltransferase family protein [Planctomycetes bacterium]|nr:nucleotidyltransferase family protein [Planctomycetota bacterium]
MGIREIKQKVIPVLKKYGVKRAGLFGSAANGKDTKDSDVDILVEITRDDINLLGFIHIKSELEEALNKKVDLVEYSTIKPIIRKRVLAEEVALL